MQVHSAQYQDFMAARRFAAAGRGAIVFGLAAATLMVLFAITGLGLHVYDWWRMDIRYHLVRSFWEQIQARDPNLSNLQTCFLAAVAFVAGACMVGWLLGRRMGNGRLVSGFLSMTLMLVPAVFAALTIGASIFFGASIFLNFMVEYILLSWLEFIAIFACVCVVFFLPAIPAGLLARLILRVWVDRKKATTASEDNQFTQTAPQNA